MSNSCRSVPTRALAALRVSVLHLLKLGGRKRSGECDLGTDAMGPGEQNDGREWGGLNGKGAWIHLQGRGAMGARKKGARAEQAK